MIFYQNFSFLLLLFQQKSGSRTGESVRVDVGRHESGSADVPPASPAMAESFTGSFPQDSAVKEAAAGSAQDLSPDTKKFVKFAGNFIFGYKFFFLFYHILSVLFFFRRASYCFESDFASIYSTSCRRSVRNFSRLYSHFGLRR